MMKMHQTGSTYSTKQLKSFTQFLNESSSLRISVYYDLGVTQQTISVWSNFFRKFFGIEPAILSSETLKAEKLREIDLLVIPGGKSFKQSLSLSDIGKKDIKEYVLRGGKMLVVCAGAFLTSVSFDWSMGMVPLKIDVEQKLFLSNEVFYTKFNVTEKGQEVFNTSLDEVVLHFHGGPVFEKAGECEVLLTFGENLPHEKNSYDTKEKIAASLSKFGNGSIISISPHIEKTEMYQYILANTVNYLIRQC